jgi:hypothetical protein
MKQPDYGRDGDFERGRMQGFVIVSDRNSLGSAIEQKHDRASARNKLQWFIRDIQEQYPPHGHLRLGHGLH